MAREVDTRAIASAQAQPSAEKSNRRVPESAPQSRKTAAAEVMITALANRGLTSRVSRVPAIM
jgi:hypothetical protein